MSKITLLDHLPLDKYMTIYLQSYWNSIIFLLK